MTTLTKIFYEAIDEAFEHKVFETEYPHQTIVQAGRQATDDTNKDTQTRESLSLVDQVLYHLEVSIMELKVTFPLVQELMTDYKMPLVLARYFDPTNPVKRATAAIKLLYHIIPRDTTIQRPDDPKKIHKMADNDLGKMRYRMKIRPKTYQLRYHIQRSQLAAIAAYQILQSNFYKFLAMVHREDREEMAKVVSLMGLYSHEVTEIKSRYPEFPVDSLL